MELLTVLTVGRVRTAIHAVQVLERVLSYEMWVNWKHRVAVLFKDEDTKVLTELEGVILVRKQCKVLVVSTFQPSRCGFQPFPICFERLVLD